ncbi:hypothetical protein, partial [Mesorhizobium sp.]|uniref:hypothetical protein n=1 Tax=Mesorhizobium sp. TaxID=1871066 RepID=UPI00257947C2
PTSPLNATPFLQNLTHTTLPGEVATSLRPLIAELYGDDNSLPTSGVKRLLEAFALMDMPYHEWDTKIGRRYITREGLAELTTRMRAEPLKALQSFASKKSIKTYEDRLTQLAAPAHIAVEAPAAAEPGVAKAH